MISAETYIKSQGLIAANDRVLVGVSGGLDSTVLAHFLHRQGVAIGIAHVNYQLRGNDSDLDQAHVIAFAKALNVPVYVRKCRLPEGANVQEWARNERYAFFHELASEHSFQKIATGHHFNDQVETVFINLMRGTGIRGVAGMPSATGMIIRPFLTTKRQDLESYVDEHALTFRDDKSNDELDYLRNQIRHQLIPIIGEIGDNSLGKVGRSIELLESDKLAMVSMAQHLLIQKGEGFQLEVAKLPEIGRETWVYQILRDYGFNRHQAHDLCHAKTGAVIESEDYLATPKNGRIVLVLKQQNAEPVMAHSEGEYTFEQAIIRINHAAFDASLMPKTPRHMWLDRETIQEPLTLRYGLPNELFIPLGSGHTVVLKKYLKDKGVDRLNRSKTLVVGDATGRIVCIPNFQISDLAKCTDATKSVISIELSYF